MNYRLQCKDIVGSSVILNHLGHLIESNRRHFKIVCIEAIIPPENEAISVCNDKHDYYNLILKCHQKRRLSSVLTQYIQEVHFLTTVFPLKCQWMFSLYVDVFFTLPQTQLLADLTI